MRIGIQHLKKALFTAYTHGKNDCTKHNIECWIENFINEQKNTEWNLKKEAENGK